MITRGHLPVHGVGFKRSHVNQDVEPFLRQFLPKGTALNKHTLREVVAKLHLAFKGMEAEEIYDVLMSQLIETLQGYDPDYKIKIQRVTGVIQRELRRQKQFGADDVNGDLEFDCARHLRVLARGGFLEVVPGGGYTRSASWPPPAEYFEGKPIGVAYYLQKWFRYGLQDWISKRMRELETKEGVYSLVDCPRP
jgi:hypothetical protein